MAKPNSLTTLIRYRLADLIHPNPPVGKAWCEGCVLNGGETLEFSAKNLVPHINHHKETYPGKIIRLNSRDYKKETQ